MRFTVIVTVWIILILLSKTNYMVPAVCGALHFLAMICDELNKARKQRTEDAMALRRTIQAVGIDITNKI